MPERIKTLLFSTLYPSSERPGHGIFVETRLRHLLQSGRVDTRVVAPVPWFPLKHSRFGGYAKMARTPRREEFHDIEVHHPRYFLPPKIGTNMAPYTLAQGAMPTIRRIIAEGFDFDLIDAHYFYPDGVAASIIAEKLDKPLVITARGTDITLLKQYPKPRQLILRAAQRADACIGVCRDLMAQLEEIGADPGKTNVVRNGVDLQRFRPLDQRACRAELGLPGDGLVLVSVGHLVPVKGHDLVIRLLCEHSDAHLLIVGDGPERNALRSLASHFGLAERVHFTGARPQNELAKYYSAADVTVLASSREGWANVLLESMACGTPVVATAVNGTPEVISSPVAGRLAETRTVEALIEAVADLFECMPSRSDVRNFAEQFGWGETTQLQIQLFDRVLRRQNFLGT